MTALNDEQLPDLTNAGGGEAGGARRRAEAGATATAPGGASTLAAVMELEVPVSIELGRTQMAIEDVLALGKGSVVQLDRLVGQPVEVYVSEKPFATGEVVVTGEKFGVRILQIQAPTTRKAEAG
jgi:flagellar motor switch protein FliN